uniref:Uncharacterized protein n=1 Tax=Neolamprologus brichardi TaxID=32507 RepID=A0A3Q4ICF4_NEOBR
MKETKQGKRLEHQGHERSSDIISKFPSVFKGHGTLPYTYKIQLKDDAVPVVHAPRRVPAPLRTIKREFKKARDSKTDPYLALLSYRASSLECGASPAELLMHRKLRTTLPHISKENDNAHDNKLTDKRMKLKHRQKRNYDKTARRLEPLQERDVVRIAGPDFWDKKATVLTENGQVLRRNRRSLLKTQDVKHQDTETGTEQRGANPVEHHSEPPSPSPMSEILRRSTRPKKPTERLIEQV